jgi:hypothetical protein
MSQPTFETIFITTGDFQYNFKSHRQLPESRNSFPKRVTGKILPEVVSHFMYRQAIRNCIFSTKSQQNIGKKTIGIHTKSTDLIFRTHPISSHDTVTIKTATYLRGTAGEGGGGVIGC